MCDMTNGLHITLQKYRRGDDYHHYRFVGSLYPRHGRRLEEAREMARAEYPTTGGDHPPDTTLCLSHRNREKTNERVNGILRGRRAHAVFVAKPRTSRPRSPTSHRICGSGPTSSSWPKSPRVIA